MSLEEHLSALLAQVHPLEPLDITLNEALGCQLVGAITAPIALPHFARCATAGYAVRHADLTGATTLKVVDDVAPGFAASQPVYAGVTVRVAAGTPLPAGADTVVAGPDAAVGQDVVITEAPPQGTGVQAAGSIAPEGAEVLADGAMVDATAVGLLAGVGQMRVPVRPRPRVVVVTIGTELLPVGATITPGLVPDSAGPLLCALAEEHGGLSYRVGPIPLEERAVHQAVDDQLIRADLLVVVGEISQPGGIIRSQLARLGEVSFDEGSTSLGVFGHGAVGEEHVPLLALPGDPAVAALLFGVLAVPMIHAMRGVRAPAPVQVRLGGDVARAPVTRLVPARMSGGEAVPVSGRDLNLLDLNRADVVLRILPGAGVQEKGAGVLALPLRSGPS